MATTRNYEAARQRAAPRFALKSYRAIFVQDIEGFVLANRITPERTEAIIYADGGWVLWYWSVE